MSIPCKSERSLMAHDEFETIKATHHPFIYELDRQRLQEARVRVRALLDRERTLARQKRRELRGKAEPRGKSFPGTAERPFRREQAFASALKRINKEIARQTEMEARAINIETARRLLAQRRAANFVHHPESGRSAGEGMQSLPSRRRRTRVPSARIGSISQAVKTVQAVRDARRG